MSPSNCHTNQAQQKLDEENLKDIGIDVELEALDGGTWFGNLSEGTFEMSTFATNANSPDPIDPPTYVVGTKMLYSQGDTSKLAELIGEYNSSDDDGKATVIQEVDDYLTDEAPYIVLAATKVIVARQPTLKGLEVLPWSTYYYDTIEK